jgi:predicted RNase H-like HicB family nuclease
LRRASEHEALANLQAALELYVQSPQASDAPQVSKVRVDTDAA